MSVLISLFFFFGPFYCLSFQSHGSSGFLRNAPFTVSLRDAVSLCISVLPFPSWMSLCLCPPSFTFTKACPSLPQHDSVSLLLPVPFSYHMSKSVIRNVAKFVFPSTFQTLLAQSEPLLYRDCADTTVLYATKQCNSWA